MKKVDKKIKGVSKNDPIDQASLDLDFVEGFINLLWDLTANKDIEIRSDAVSVMCYESKFKIENLKKFINDLNIFGA